MSCFEFEIRMLRLPSIKFITAVILDYIELWKSKCFTKLKSILFLLTYNSKITKVILPKHAKKPSFLPYACIILSNLCYSRAHSYTHTHKQGMPKTKNICFTEAWIETMTSFERRIWPISRAIFKPALTKLHICVLLRTSWYPLSFHRSYWNNLINA